MILWDLVVLFFFKQKTAYDMRISDWSSDVCSSDLLAFQPFEAPDEVEAACDPRRVEAPLEAILHLRQMLLGFQRRRAPGAARLVAAGGKLLPVRKPHGDLDMHRLEMSGNGKIGRASCRERVCQYV